MLRVTNVTVSQAIIHRLDNQVTPPSGLEKSDFPLNMTVGLADVIATHVKKAMEDGRIRFANFRDKSNNFVATSTASMFSQSNSFIAQSQNLAKALYNSMTVSKSISAADVIVCKLQCDGVDYIGVLKLDYKVHYLSEVQQQNGGQYIGVRQIGKGWPELGSRLQKAVFVKSNPTDFDVIVLDRQQRVDSAVDVSKFFQEAFLRVDLIPDEKSNSKGFIRGVKEFIKVNEASLSIAKQEQIYNSAVSTLLNSETINVELFAQGQFDIENEDEALYIEAMVDCLGRQGVTRGEFRKDPEVARQYSKKRIDLDGLRIDVDFRLLNTEKFHAEKRVGNDGKTYADITIRGVEVLGWDD